MKAIGSGVLATGSALCKDSAAAKGKSVEAVVIGSIDTGLMVSGSVSAGSILGMDCEAATDLSSDLRPGSVGISGAKVDTPYHYCFMMRVKCWNVRGLNSPLKQHEVVNLMKKSSVDVCGLLETKLSLSEFVVLQKFWLKKWKFSDECCSVFYGSHCCFLESLYEDLFGTVFVSGAPRAHGMVLGDFNSLMSQDDKLNGSAVSIVLVNPFWSSLHRIAHVHFGNQGAFSDHSPALVRLDPQAIGHHSFKFFNMWASHTNFLHTVLEG
ncbi:hypothetical protein OIU76_030000 [Salix suchowensis]|nr:hypothetical protein OIU76_030000 [Salix suchowensis]